MSDISLFYLDYLCLESLRSITPYTFEAETIGVSHTLFKSLIGHCSCYCLMVEGGGIWHSPCLLVSTFTNRQFKEGVRLPYCNNILCFQPQGTHNPKLQGKAMLWIFDMDWIDNILSLFCMQKNLVEDFEAGFKAAIDEHSALRYITSLH